jgi:hypothetical protein
MTTMVTNTEHKRSDDLERYYMAPGDAHFNLLVAQQADLIRAAAQLEIRIRDVLITNGITTSCKVHARSLRCYQSALRLIASNARFFLQHQAMT